jgi:hypothetical protein
MLQDEVSEAHVQAWVASSKNRPVGQEKRSTLTAVAVLEQRMKRRQLTGLRKSRLVGLFL